MLKKRPIIKWFTAFALAVGTTTSLPVLPSQAAANVRVQPEIVVDAVEGQGTDSNSARLDAFRNAIAQAVGTYVSSDTIVENYVTKSDKIRVKTEGFIKNFTKIRETQAEGIFTATYKVVVSSQPIREDLKAVVGTEFSNVGHPRVCVVGWYQGRDRAETEANVTAVTAMNRALIKRGYKVVDPWQVAKLRAEDKEIVKASGQVTKTDFDEVAQLIANRLLADIYVTTFGSVASGRASVATKIFNSYTGQVFGDDTGYAAMREASLAAAKAAVEIAVSSSMERILPELSKHWQDVLTNGQEYAIILEGYKDGDQRRQFKDILKELDGVTEVKQLNAAGNHAEFSVYSTSEPVDMFDEIISAGQKVGFKFFNKEAVIRGGRAIFILQ